MEIIDKGAPFVVDTREVLPEESVGVIDVQKEREAFEVYLLSQGVDLKYLPCIYFNGTSYDQEDGDEDYEVALSEINLCWNAWQAAKAQAVPEGFVLVEKSKISYFYQDSDEPENCCNHERDFDCLGDCIDDGDIIQIDRYAEIHLSKDTFFGTWCECEPKPFSRKTREFRLFPSREDAEKAMIEAQEPSHD